MIHLALAIDPISIGAILTGVLAGAGSSAAASMFGGRSSGAQAATASPTPPPAPTQAAPAALSPIGSKPGVSSGTQPTFLGAAAAPAGGATGQKTLLGS